MNINDAFTFHIPDRVMDENLLTFCLPDIIEKIKAEDAENGSRNAITLMKNSNMRIVLIILHAGAEMNFHECSNTISVQVIEGEISFQTHNQSIHLTTGALLSCHEEYHHTLTAVEETVLLLTIAIGRK